uniref:RNase H type-1 domain-containing protein n=1 Tax=Cannabis sativa TaxID=3483 RepID=A0A803NM84_CANSA
MLFGDTLLRVDILPELAFDALSEFQDHREICFFEVAIEPILQSSSRWLPPLAGFALATDAAVVPGRGFVDLGGVVRDGSGVLWASWVVGVVVDFAVLVAELLAVGLDLEMALQFGFSLLRVGCDSTVVVSWVNNLNLNVFYQSIIYEICLFIRWWW